MNESKSLLYDCHKNKMLFEDVPFYDRMKHVNIFKLLHTVIDGVVC